MSRMCMYIKHSKFLNVFNFKNVYMYIQNVPMYRTFNLIKEAGI